MKSETLAKVFRFVVILGGILAVLSASYKMITPDGDVWRRSVADNRLELSPKGDTFRILAGM